MYSHQSIYDYNILINDYQNSQIERFTDNFNKIFSVNHQMADEQLQLINEILDENLHTHNYISQILMEQVADIKVNPARPKVKNLLSELDFARLAYRDYFEKDSLEIDEVENLMLEWDRLLKLNRKIYLFIFSQNNYNKELMEMLIEKKELLCMNMEKLHGPLQDLYHNRQESLGLYNNIMKMTYQAHKIYKSYE